MPLDGLFLHHLTEELQTVVGCRADKIHQPSKDELVFLLRSAAFSGKLLLSAKSGSARVHITESSFENPADPPTFCKLVRKHFSSAKIMSVEQLGLERVLKISFFSYNEMGDTVFPYIIVELITGRANIVLCDQTGRIIDALHRSDLESAARILQPGAIYAPPEKENKLNPFTETEEALFSAILKSRKPLSLAFMQGIDGISPLVSRELCLQTALDPDGEVNVADQDKIKDILKGFKQIVALPHLLLTDKGEPKDFSYMPIYQYGELIKSKEMPSFSALLDSFYSEKDALARAKARSQDVIRLVSNIKSRIERRLGFRKKDLEKCQNREKYRIYGELLKANLYAIPKGLDKISLQNYYDENLAVITIPLDPSLSPSANASKYFKEYKKTYTAEQTLTELIKKDEEELGYIETVIDSLSRCTTLSDFDEIRDELADEGYIIRRNTKKKKPAPVAFKQYMSKNRFKILVGRNNRENDLLTLKTASKSDIWFHTKNIPGSHTVLITDGKSPENDDLIFAASLAAENSKAAASDNVPVDFCEVRYVKKPSGAKAGMVIYTDYKTLFVKPNKN